MASKRIKKKWRKKAQQKQQLKHQQQKPVSEYNDTNYYEYFDPESGEIFEESAYSLYEYSIIEGFYARLNSFNPAYTFHLKKWIKYIVDEYGIAFTSKMLQDGAEAGLIISKKVIYDEEEQAFYMNTMLNYLPDVQKSTRATVEEITDEITFSGVQDDFWL